MADAFDVVLFALDVVFAIWQTIIRHFALLNLTSGLFFFFAFYRFILRPILGGDFFGAKSAASDMARSRSSDKADNKRK